MTVNLDDNGRGPLVAQTLVRSLRNFGCYWLEFLLDWKCLVFGK